MIKKLKEIIRFGSKKVSNFYNKLKKMNKIKLWFINRFKKQTEFKLEPIKLEDIVPVSYHYILASEKFLLVDEPLEEVLRERAQHYRRKNKLVDFWLIRSPQFFKSEQLSELRLSLPENTKYTAIVSTDKMFVTWLKLRYHHVAIGSFLAPTNDIPNPLGSYSTEE